MCTFPEVNLVSVYISSLISNCGLSHALDHIPYIEKDYHIDQKTNLNGVIMAHTGDSDSGVSFYSVHCV